MVIYFCELIYCTLASNLFLWTEIYLKETEVSNICGYSTNASIFAPSALWNKRSSDLRMKKSCTHVGLLDLLFTDSSLHWVKTIIAQDHQKTIVPINSCTTGCKHSSKSTICSSWTKGVTNLNLTTIFSIKINPDSTQSTPNQKFLSRMWEKRREITRFIGASLSLMRSFP